MLRLTDFKLPVGHSDEALGAAILKKLRVAAADLLSFKVVRRGQDARKKHNVLYVYTVDAEVADEAAVLARLKDSHVRRAPDMDYKFVARAPENFTRPLVIGAGPSGLFAALVLAQWDLPPSSWSAAKTCAPAPRTPGACGGE